MKSKVEPSRIVVLISGGGTNLQAIINACKLESYPGKVAGVISNKANVYGLTRAEDAKISTVTLSHKDFNSRDSYDKVLMDKIDNYSPDLVVLAGFMRILTPSFVEHYQGRLLNIHPSLLPKYQGLNTHQRAIDAKDNEHGVSVHFVTEELDGGPVILQAKVPVFSEDTSEDLAARVHEQEHRIYPLVIKWFCQNRLVMKKENAILDNIALLPSGYAND